MKKSFQKKEKTKPIDEREKTINIQLRPYSQQTTQNKQKMTKRESRNIKATPLLS